MDFGKIFSTAQEIILKPFEAFNKLKDENVKWMELFVNYFIVLAGIAVIGNFISGIRFSVSYGIGLLIVFAAVYAAQYFISVYVASFLSKNFDGSGDLDSCGKLIAYSATPALIASFFTFIPVLGALLSLAGLVYSIYLFYVGSQVFLGVPKDKSVGFVIVFAIVDIIAVSIVYFILGAIIIGSYGTGMVVRRGMF